MRKITFCVFYSPEGVWRAKVADSFSRDIFFVALARSLNIAADMRKMDGAKLYGS